MSDLPSVAFELRLPPPSKNDTEEPKPVEYISIQIDHSNRLCRRATDADRERYADVYKVFKAGPETEPEPTVAVEPEEAPAPTKPKRTRKPKAEG